MDTMLNESRIAAAIDDAVLWRHHLHERPELLYEVEETAAFVAERLRSFGCDTVETEIGRTGVVATILGRRGTSERRIALRAACGSRALSASTIGRCSSTRGVMPPRLARANILAESGDLVRSSQRYSITLRIAALPVALAMARWKR